MRDQLKKPLSLKDILLETFKNNLNSSLSDFDQLKDQWRHLVGLPLGDNSQPLKISKNKLYVEVTAAVWNHEMYYKKHELIELFEKKYPSLKIQEIKTQLKRAIL